MKKSITVRLTEEEMETLERLREETLDAFGIGLTQHAILKQAINMGFKRIGKFTSEGWDGMIA